MHLKHSRKLVKHSLKDIKDILLGEPISSLISFKIDLIISEMKHLLQIENTLEIIYGTKIN